MATERACVPAYHRWFTEYKLPYSRPGGILDGDLLCDIATEHPYTFAHAEASMDLITKKARDRTTLHL